MLRFPSIKGTGTSFLCQSSLKHQQDRLQKFHDHVRKLTFEELETSGGEATRKTRGVESFSLSGRYQITTNVSIV